jgi:hypothetical protein
LIAALAALSKDPTAVPHISSLLSLISIHLAITIGLYKSLRVEKTLQMGLNSNLIFMHCFIVFRMRRTSSGKQTKNKSTNIRGSMTRSGRASTKQRLELFLQLAMMAAKIRSNSAQKTNAPF